MFILTFLFRDKSQPKKFPKTPIPAGEGLLQNYDNNLSHEITASISNAKVEDIQLVLLFKSSSKFLNLLITITGFIEIPCNSIMI